jgi:formate-dependent nitrite reductase membrane component NrfD
MTASTTAPTTLNPYVADPGWHDYIVWYFFLGGIAAGAYVMAALADLFGTAADRRAVRPAYYLAFPLVNVCGLLLVVDLNRPERFWHMLVQSRTGWPSFKWWSPISVGSWGLSLFGAFSLASFLGVLAEDGRLGLRRFSGLAARLRTGRTGRLFALGGALSAFFLGSYTGVLLGASNQPVWADTTWIGALFLASAASTGVAAMILADRLVFRDVGHAAIENLERLDAFAIALELALLAILAGSLGGLAPAAFGRWPGWLVPAVVVPFGLLLPLLVRRLPARGANALAALLVLAGGFLLRFAFVYMPTGFHLMPGRHG